MNESKPSILWKDFAVTATAAVYKNRGVWLIAILQTPEGGNE